MALSTLTRYLRLRVRTDLSQPASQNLARLDSLGFTFAVDENDNLEVRSRGNLLLRPEAGEVGGAGSGGELHLGSASHPVAIKMFGSSFSLKAALGIENDSGSKISLATASGQATDKTITMLASANVNITFGHSGNIVTDESSQTLTNKSISGASNLISNINYSSLVGSPDGTVLPSYTDNDGKYLKLVDGELSWATAAEGGSGMEVSKSDWTSGTSLTVTHNFATTDVLVSMWDLTSGEPVYTDNVTRNSNSVELSVPSGTTPNYRVVVVKA